MHKIIIFILITLSISSISCKTNHEDSDKICIDNFRILLFRNFNDGNTKIPNEILKNNTNEFYYYNVISISKLISFNKNLVTGDTFDFLCQNVFLLSWEDFNKMAFINGHDFGHGSFDDFVIKESKDLKIYYVGKYFVKHNIDSYLFLFETQYERGGHLFRLYLINSQNNAITSIVKVADFFQESETINGYTVRCSINNFVYNREHNSSDMLVTSNEKDIFLTPSCV
ncbi:MAG: hypothetical protein PHW83_13795, partial [Bacteroidales bacterium]|nr:hypothetical protein [Bacteroidales bacterium]